VPVVFPQARTVSPINMAATTQMISVGKEEIQKMIDDGEPIEVNCHFCNSHYTFTVDELKEMYDCCTR